MPSVSWNTLFFVIINRLDQVKILSFFKAKQTFLNEKLVLTQDLAFLKAIQILEEKWTKKSNSMENA
jgi:hypothetical protein